MIVSSELRPQQTGFVRCVLVINSLQDITHGKDKLVFIMRTSLLRRILSSFTYSVPLNKQGLLKWTRWHSISDVTLILQNQGQHWSCSSWNCDAEVRISVATNNSHKIIIFSNFSQRIFTIRLCLFTFCSLLISWSNFLIVVCTFNFAVQ